MSMTNWVLVSAFFVMVFPSSGIAQSKDALVGTWKLVSATDTTDKGEVKDAYGQNPTGFITYTADGRMMAIITNDGRKPLSIRDWVAAPAEERAEAFATLVAYAGSYTLNGDKVIHHVQASWIQNSVNTDLARTIVKLQDNRITLRTGAFFKGGVQIAKEELVFERMKPETASR
jgi:lipocalin-like protein